MDTTITHVGLPRDLTRRYDELAEETGRDREELLVEALEEYLARIAAEDARIEAAIAAADHGDVVDAEVVRAEAEALLARVGVTPEQLARIEAEVRREADAVYGPCE
jgi:predicted transcriptional regulator